MYYYNGALLILKACVQPRMVVQVYNPSTQLRQDDCLEFKANLSNMKSMSQK